MQVAYEVEWSGMTQEWCLEAVERYIWVVDVPSFVDTLT